MPTEAFFNIKIDKRTRIIEACIEEMSKYPYEEIKISNIVQNARIPRGSFYYYFQDKLDMYLFVTKYVYEIKINMIKEVDITNIYLYDLLNILADKVFEFVHLNNKYFSLAKYIYSSDNDEIIKAYTQKKGEYLEEIKKIISLNINEGNFRGDLDIDVISNFFIAFLREDILSLFCNDKVEYKKHFETLLSLMEYGTKPR